MSATLTAPLPASVLAALAHARRELQTLYGDRLAGLVLYGSHARGEARADSDVDVLVLLHSEVNVPAEDDRRALNRKAHLLTVWDVEKGDVRTVNLNTVESVLAVKTRAPQPTPPAPQAMTMAQISALFDNRAPRSADAARARRAA